MAVSLTVWSGNFIEHPTLHSEYNFFDRILNIFGRDRKSTRLNSSHQIISYAVFCLKKKTPLVSSPYLALTTPKPRTIPITMETKHPHRTRCMPSTIAIHERCLPPQI